MENNENKPAGGGRPFLAVALAVAFVALLSLLPWEKWTSGTFKDYDLLGDLSRAKPEKEAAAADNLDPELKAAERELTAAAPEAGGKREASDSVPPAADPVRGGMVVLEDYTPSGQGLLHLRAALCGGRPARIAMAGDSYIEGDIFSQDVRDLLQQCHGGSGPGFMTPGYALPGFRRSVRQSDSGWTEHDLRNGKADDSRWIAGMHYTGGPGAKSEWRGIASNPRLASWQRARIVYRADSGGVITVDAGNGPQQFAAEATGTPREITVAGPMSQFSFTNTSVPSLTVYGVWLEGNAGISVDNMSLRGYSGVSHRKITPALPQALSAFTPYDLIVLEYGMNALSASQKDYTAYGRLMEQTLNSLKEAYPNADIILMGVGDRGAKNGSSVTSLPTATPMVEAQRMAARRAGVLFWDTRRAMGGDGAAVAWRNDGLLNADYIHLNHKGGARLGKLFADAVDENLTGIAPATSNVPEP